MLENPVMLEIPVVTQENLANTIPRMSIHKRIKDLREQRGLSMQALAKLVGVSAWQTIQQWEREDGTAPKRERLKAVADALGTTDAYLMFGTTEDVPDERSRTDAEEAVAEQKSVDALIAAKGDLGARLQTMVGETGATYEGIAHLLNVTPSVIDGWLLGPIKKPFTLDHAVKLQEKFGFNAVWLFAGKGERTPGARYNDEYRPVPLTKWKPVPVVGMAQLGDHGHWADLEYPVGFGDGFVDFPTRDPNAYALKCEGDSMRPRIQPGEFVVVEPNQPVEPGDDVLVKSKDGRVMVKRFLYKAQGRAHLISVNDAHAPLSFKDDEIEKMHFVRAICRPSSWRPE
jgi:phage repressor protein C with HTH and peptisase S24 domain/transcriptional regulator with XRE-family HTH domain